MDNKHTLNPVGWFEVYVDDMSRAKAFYEAVFQTSLEHMPKDDMPGFDMWLFPGNETAYGAQGALVKMPGMDAGKNSVMVYFNCDDCAVEAQRAESAGGKIERPKFSIGEHGFIALVQDTEGNIIGLHSMK